MGDWQQVWQYGSDLDRPDQANADPLWEQDGVAPQCAVTGINADPAKGGRVYIPARYANGQPIPKNYLDSHYIINYGWIFEQPKGQPGYVTPK